MNFHKLRCKITNSGVKPQKKGSLLQNLQKKTVLAHEFWGDNQYLGSLRPRTALQWHRACYFLWGTILAWGGTILVWGGTSCDFGGHGPGMPRVASGLLQVYSNLSNCNYRIFVTEILIEIGFIEEM